jgi:DNA-binding MarR family transcriptional regulator
LTTRQQQQAERSTGAARRRATMRLRARTYARLPVSVSSADVSDDTLAAKEDVLIAIRKIIRATDLHSRQLTKTVGLTAPQLLVLQAIRDLGAVAISRLSSEVSLSQATVTTILDRLEKRGLVDRRRSEQDKRVVHALLTDEGRAVVESAPTPLQEAFSVRFEQLETWEQSLILSALQRVAAMMDAEDIDASPFLELGDLSQQLGD